MSGLEHSDILAFSIAPHKTDASKVTTFHYNKNQLLECMKRFQKIVQDGSGFARTENAIPLRVFGTAYHALAMELCCSLTYNLMDGYGNFSFLKNVASGSGLNDLIRRLEWTGSPKLIVLFKSEKNRDQTLHYIMRYPNAVKEMMGPNIRQVSEQIIRETYSSESRKYKYCDGLDVMKVDRSAHELTCDSMNWVWRDTPFAVTCVRTGKECVWRTHFFSNLKARIHLARQRAEKMWKTQRHYYDDWNAELCRRMDDMNLKWPRSVEIPYNAPYMETIIMMDAALYIHAGCME